MSLHGKKFSVGEHMKSNTHLIILIAATVLLLNKAAAFEPIQVPTQKNYKSGRQLCKENEVIISYQKGFYTEVPLDYSDLSKGTTPIYAWFEKGYNKELPTLAHFTGGPGQTSHWGSGDLPDSDKYNFLTFDLRGLGCSKPDRLSDYLNPKFHSSENMARDLEVIRKKLGIDKISVHGVSFGTVAATIYGSLFPQSTRAVILEGTVYSSKTVFMFTQRQRLILEVLETLPFDIQKKLINLTAQHGVPPSWLFKWIRDQLIMNNGKEKLRNNFLRIADANEFKGFIEELTMTYGPHPDIPKNELFISNNTFYYMLTCQEFEMALPTTTFELQWNPEWVSEWNKNPDILNSNPKNISPFIRYFNEAVVSCRKINIINPKGYSAENYPLQVPVTYFQGLNDSATEVHGAVFHYQNTAKGLRQFLLMSNGGHNPLAENLVNKIETARVMLVKAIMGEEITTEDLNAVNANMEKTKWLFHQPK